MTKLINADHKLLLEAVWESSADAMRITDSSGNVISVNSAYCSLTGIKKEELIGKSFFEVYDKKEQPELMKYYLNFISSGKIIERSNKKVTLSDKRVCNIEASYSQIEMSGVKYVLAIIRDVTVQKLGEALLKENEERYRTLFGISPSGIILLDEKGIILESNDAISKILQYAPEELRGMDVRQLSLPERYDKIDKDIKKILSGEILENQIENIRKDGTICIIELHEKAITLKNGQRGILAIVNDITRKKQAEESDISLRKQIRTILDTVPSYIFAKDYDGKFLMVNKSLADLFGVPPEEVVGKTDSDYGATPEQIKGYITADRQVIDSGKELFIKEEQVLRNDGSLGWFQTNKIPYHHPGINKPAILGVAVDITERKLVEEALRENERLLKESQIIAGIGSYVLDIPTGFWTSSEILDNIFGIDKNFVRSVEGWTLLIHSDYQEQMAVYFQDEVLGKCIRFDKEYKIKRQNDGEERWVHGLGELELNEKGLPVKMIGTIMDITERKKAEEELKESEIKFRNLIETMPVGFYRSTSDGHFIDVNPALVKMLGFKNKEELMQVNIPETLYFSKDERVDGVSYNVDFISDSEIYRLKKKDGSEIWVEDNARYIKDNTGNVLYHEGIMRDITESLRARKAILDAKEKAEELSRTKTNILANMSHEVRTPMNSIIGYANILKYELANPEQIKYADNIEKSSKRLLETLDLILNYAKLEAEKQDINYSNVKIEDIINDTIESFGAVAKMKNIYLKSMIKTENLTTKSDERFLRHILNNIVNNAIKFTNAGGVSIELSKENDNVVIKVIDTGIGIAKEKHEIIFEEFRQESEGYSRNFEGTGLGLSITKRFVEMMNGKIYVESELGNGSVFTVELPYKTFSKSINIKLDYKVTGIEKSEPLTVSGKKLLILLVEDDDINSSLIKTMLSNYNLDSVADGLSAIQKVKEKIFDIILMDINLGKGMDGKDVVKEIRKFKNYEKTPIVALTAYVLKGDKEEFIAAGCTHYLGKPFTKDQLNNLIQEIKEKILEKK